MYSVKLFLVAIVLVAIFCMFYLRPGGYVVVVDDNSGVKSSREGDNQSAKKGVRGSTSPPESPLPPAIEVKSLEEVKSHIKDKNDNNPTTALPSHFYTEDNAEINFRSIRYRFPSQMFQNISSSFKAEDPGVVVCVLSAPEHVSLRDVIRKTWAFGRSNVFFMVGGNWDDLVPEIRHNRDIFWIDSPEGFNFLALKSQVFAIAAKTHLRFRFLLKTDDDSYIRLHDFEQLAIPKQTTSPESDSEQGTSSASEQGTSYSAKTTLDSDWSAFDYVGSCVNNRPVPNDNTNPHALGVLVAAGSQHFPTYAAGAGYLISKNFVDCLAKVAANAPIIATMEDVNTGVYANICHMPCQHSDRILNMPDSGILSPQSESNFLVAHYLGHHGASVEDILVTLHANTCQQPSHVDPIACAEGSYRTAPELHPNNNNAKPTRSNDLLEQEGIPQQQEQQPHEQQQQQQQQQQQELVGDNANTVDQESGKKKKKRKNDVDMEGVTRVKKPTNNNENP